MSENETYDPAGASSTEKSKSVGIGKIDGEKITVIGYNKTRGKPSQYTNQEDIGEDGKTDYFTISTAESFDLPPKKDEPEEPISSFFVSQTIINQIERIETNDTKQPVNEVPIGPFKVVKRLNPKNDRRYWTLATKSDPDWD